MIRDMTDKTKRMLGYIVLVATIIGSTALYFHMETRQSVERCIDGRRDLRDAISWTVTYALGFEADTEPEDIANNQRFTDGLEEGLQQQFPDEGCK